MNGNQTDNLAWLADNPILNIVRRQYKLALQGIHGLSHWERVEKFGLFLADATKADKTVISYFAYLHDSQRLDESEDAEHGKRASEFVGELYKSKVVQLSPVRLQQLQFACRYHNERKMFDIDDVTIQTCWDADRLDLPRIGIKPNPDYLYTETAKKFVAIEHKKS